MFHLFTLQGKRIDAQLEQLHPNVRVHHTRENSRARKYIEGEPKSTGGQGGGGTAGNYAADAYRETMRMESIKTEVFHAGEIMSYPVFTIEPDTPVLEAWKKFMEKKVHHMPVLSAEGNIIGIVSDRDLLKKIVINNGHAETSKDVTVEAVMSTEVIATTPLTDIRRIAKAMLDNHIGAMPVVDVDGKITGIITRSDILFAIIHRPELKLWA